MTARVWRAAPPLAALGRSSQNVQESIASARMPLAFCTSADGDRVVAQPFYLWLYLPAVMSGSPYAQSLFPQTWLEKGALLANSYTAMIEWLRCRLSGYPFPDAPQLAPASPGTTFTLSMQGPWMAGQPQWPPQDQRQPLVIPLLAVAASAQREATASLATAVATSPAAVEIEERWHA